MAIKAFKKNVTKEVAEMSGRGIHHVCGDKLFEQRVMDAAKDMETATSSRSPLRHDSGLACNSVRTAQIYGARIGRPGQLLAGTKAIRRFQPANPALVSTFTAQDWPRFYCEHRWKNEVFLPGSGRLLMAPSRLFHGNLTLDT